MSDINDKKYYEYRKEIRKLYKNDVRMNGDICSRILELRDKNKFVEYINIALQDYYISLEVSDDTESNKVDDLVYNIFARLSMFINENRNSLEIDSNEDFDTFVNPSNYLLADVIVVGNSVEIYL